MRAATRRILGIVRERMQDKQLWGRARRGFAQRHGRPAHFRRWETPRIRACRDAATSRRKENDR